MTLQQSRFDTSYNRWKHKTLGYKVKVVDIRHNSRPDGSLYSVVIVEGTHLSKKQKRTWPASTFRDTFTPIGAKNKDRTVLDYVLTGEDLDEDPKAPT
jgi:hypothetical protein